VVQGKKQKAGHYSSKGGGCGVTTCTLSSFYRGVWDQVLMKRPVKRVEKGCLSPEEKK